jgi:hypothetical protein
LAITGIMPQPSPFGHSVAGRLPAQPSLGVPRLVLLQISLTLAARAERVDEAAGWDQDLTGWLG